MAQLKRSFVLTKQQHNFVAPQTCLYQDADDYGEESVWDLCRELEELGGGI